MAAAAGGALLDPQVSVTEALAGTARLTVLAAVAAAAGLYPGPTSPPPPTNSMRWRWPATRHRNSSSTPR